MIDNKKIILLALAMIFAMGVFVISFNWKETNKDSNAENKTEKQEEIVKKDFKIELKNGKCNEKWKTIYEYPDGKKIKSKCGDIYYIDNNSNKISLKDALDKQYITIKDITNNMDQVWGAFDGGSVLFSYNASTETISNMNFNLEICNVIFGNKDQLFISYNDKDCYCN